MRLIRAWRGESGAEMPLARYFLFVGGVLLALLLISGWVLPKFPMTETAGIGADKGMGTDKDMGTDKPFVRINSDQKWPERVVFDTSVAPIAPAPTVSAEEAVTPPAPPTVVDVTAKVRDAFAQLEPPELKKPEPKPQRKRKIAKKHLGPPRVLVAQQPRFGFFVSNIW
jgi:hypothetical protein